MESVILVIVGGFFGAWHLHSVLGWRGRVRVSVELDSRDDEPDFR
jgi:hypothetical protein